MAAQPQLEDVEGISPHILGEKGSQKEIETLNVLVNEGSSVGAYTLDLIAPPKFNLEITQLPTLERNGSCEICVMVRSKRSLY